MPLSPSTTLGELIEDRQARALLQDRLPGIVNSPMLPALAGVPIADLLGPEDEEFWDRLRSIVPGAPPDHAPAITPRSDYEPADVPKAALDHPGTVARWERVELRLDGPRHGNPFVDVELSAEITDGEVTRTVPGFYDGEGTYRVRWLAERAGTWRFRTSSNARSLHGHEGTVTVTPSDAPGPVRVDGMHFAHADGTRYLPLGSTAYAWLHQPAELQERTLATLAESPFTKLRMCVFPKSYLFNRNEPERLPFVRLPGGGWDPTRFDVEFFRLLERRVRELAELGVQTDLILFHPYDRWGFSDMGPAVDERYVRYVVARLAAEPTVWWSLANEYDLVRGKSVEEWDRLGRLVADVDPHEHLLSIHNCFGFYDHTRDWISHASVQRVDVYRTAENVDEWRNRWGKPVVVDECGYEGDIDQGWGNISGEEMVRRFWEGAMRGGYVGHGETYLNDREELWWSKGGELVGESPARIGFLRELTSSMPGGVLEPIASDWDAPWAGVPGEDMLVYLGFGRSRFRRLFLPPDQEFTVDVIDTWAMTSERLPGTVRGLCTVPLPGRQWLALRITRA